MWLFKKNKKYKSDINGQINIGRRANEKAVFSGGVTQSGGELKKMWEFASKRLREDFPYAKDCLVLGVGGGTCISTLTKSIPSIKIVAIEIDKVMIDIYNDNLKDNKANLVLLNDDAISWVKKNNKKFDVIMVDIYIGRWNPPATRKNEFMQDLLSHLRKNGVIIYSCHFDIKNPEEFDKFKKIAEKYFNIEIIYEFPLNKLLLLNQRGNTSKSLKKKL